MTAETAQAQENKDKDPDKPEDPQGSAPSAAPPAEDPRVVAARVELELAKIAREKERLGLTDQSARAKLIKDMIPDLSGVTVEKDTTSASEKPSALAECMIQQSVLHVVDDIADDIIHAVNRLPVTQQSPRVDCLFVTSDGSHRDDLAAHRDVVARLARLDRTLDRLCPVQQTRPEPSEARLAALPMVTALLGALPGAITLATRLFAHQYTTSSYTSTGHAGVDLHTAGALVSRTQADPGTRVVVRRLQPAPDRDLRTRLLAFAGNVDERLSQQRVRARVDAAVAAATLEGHQERRTQLAARTSDLFAAWKDKVGRSAGTAGLQEDLALVKALDDAIAEADPESAEKKRLVAVREGVQKRITAVLEEVAAGTGEIGTPQLLDMVQNLEDEDRALAQLIVDARRAQASADERVRELDALHTAATEFLESLGAADGSGERLFDRACHGALLADTGTAIVYVRLLHAGADGVDVTKVSPDQRNTMHGASVEWALLRGEATVDAGVRTQLGYHRTNLSRPEKATSGRLASLNRPRVDLEVQTTGPR